MARFVTLLLLAATTLASQTQKKFGINEEPLGWADPRLHGGRQLDFTTEEYGEPLNVIISGLSDPFVLTDHGFKQYTKSIGFSEECLGLHYEHSHSADLGDGKGRVVEQFLSREYYFGAMWGTCWETVAGGHRFRGWKQNGTEANTGAWFLTVSKEENSRLNRQIVPNGYNIGRDWIIQKATEGTHWKGKWWKAGVEWVEGLLEPGSEGINHGIEQDGRVAVLIIQRA